MWPTLPRRRASPREASFIMPLSLFGLLPSVTRQLNRIELTLNLLLRKGDSSMSAVHDAVTRLTKEVADQRGVNASILAFLKGVPDLIRAAVAEALAANEALSAEDLAAITEAADALDASQAELLAAVGTETIPDPIPETAPPAQVPEPSLLSQPTNEGL